MKTDDKFQDLPTSSPYGHYKCLDPYKKHFWRPVVSGLADESKKIASFLPLLVNLIIHVSAYFTLSIQKK